jgi:glycosyltransferase involved in cell wall biosynthesis
LGRKIRGRNLYLLTTIFKVKPSSFEALMSDISIIIPTRNRAGVLIQAMTSIAAVVTSKDPVEIIIVDNGSSDDTASICREIKDRFPKHDWRYFYDEHPGALTGRHLGAREAKGEILAFLEDDVLLAPSWLEALDDAFKDPEVMYTGGPVCPHYKVEPPPWLTGMWMEFEKGVRVLGELSLVDLGPNRKEIDPLYVPGGNCGIRKAAFKVCGGLHPENLPKPLLRYRGDGETGLAIKIRSRGLKALYHPGAAVKHVIPGSRMTPESFEQKAFCQGVSNSFTGIRGNGFPPARAKSWKDRVRSIKWKLMRESLLRNPTAENIRFLASRSRFAGRWFHEDEVRRDPKLLEWVLKPDYFNYRLPDGWESHLNSRDASHW